MENKEKKNEIDLNYLHSAGVCLRNVYYFSLIMIVITIISAVYIWFAKDTNFSTEVNEKVYLFATISSILLTSLTLSSIYNAGENLIKSTKQTKK